MRPPIDEMPSIANRCDVCPDAFSGADLNVLTEMDRGYAD
jgi:hypothetical protein